MYTNLHRPQLLHVCRHRRVAMRRSSVGIGKSRVLCDRSFYRKITWCSYSHLLRREHPLESVSGRNTHHPRRGQHRINMNIVQPLHTVHSLSESNNANTVSGQSTIILPRDCKKRQTQQAQIAHNQPHSTAPRHPLYRHTSNSRHQRSLAFSRSTSSLFSPFYNGHMRR